MPAQFVQRARDALPRGVLREFHSRACFGKRERVEIVEQHQLAIAVIELIHRIVDHRAELFPVGREIGGRSDVGHDRESLLQLLSAEFGPCGIDRRVPGAAVKPAGQRRVMRQRSRLARQIAKNFLGNFLGQVGLAACAPQGRRVNEIKVSSHEFGEGAFVPFLNIVAQ
jgi:hypothetical protein